MRNYSLFLKLALNDTIQADKYSKKAEDIRNIEDTTGESNLMLNSQAIFTVSEEGIIESTNTAVSSLFGWSSADLEGRNIKFIIPSPYKEKHGIFMKRYVKRGEGTVIGQSRMLYGLHKLGHVFPMNLTLHEARDERGRRSFLGMVSLNGIDKEKSSRGLVLADEKGFICMANETVLNIFGYTAKEMVGKVLDFFLLSLLMKIN